MEYIILLIAAAIAVYVYCDRDKLFKQKTTDALIGLDDQDTLRKSLKERSEAIDGILTAASVAHGIPKHILLGFDSASKGTQDDFAKDRDNGGMTLGPDYKEHSQTKIPRGWTKWDGGKCPFKKKTKIRIMFRGGSKSLITNPLVYCWQNTGKDCDIIAYRIIKPKAKKAVKRVTKKPRAKK